MADTPIFFTPSAHEILNSPIMTGRIKLMWHVAPNFGGLTWQWEYIMRAASLLGHWDQRPEWNPHKRGLRKSFQLGCRNQAAAVESSEDTVRTTTVGCVSSLSRGITSVDPHQTIQKCLPDLHHSSFSKTFCLDYITQFVKHGNSGSYLTHEYRQLTCYVESVTNMLYKHEL